MKLHDNKETDQSNTHMIVWMVDGLWEEEVVDGRRRGTGRRRGGKAKRREDGFYSKREGLGLEVEGRVAPASSAVGDSCVLLWWGSGRLSVGRHYGLSVIAQGKEEKGKRKD
jgi:hypothetical protein